MRVAIVVPLFRVADVGRSIAWYREVLGFAAEPFPAEPPYEFAILRRGPAEIMGRRSAGGRPAPGGGGGWDAYVRMSGGIHALYDALQQRMPIVRRLEIMEYGDTEFEIADPDGYVLCLSEVV
jgi:catechol 2,3-dioxygenase-like lactoylglutathione lyase family enzyme